MTEPLKAALMAEGVDLLPPSYSDGPAWHD